MQRQSTLNLLYAATSKTTLFTFTYYMLLFILYLIGNYQYFLDTTQIFILQILSVFLILHCLSGLYYLFLTMVFAVKNRKIVLSKFILCTVSVTVALVLLFSVKALTALM
jgi:hypothetical protein